jgi:hypothetical protein
MTTTTPTHVAVMQYRAAAMLAAQEPTVIPTLRPSATAALIELIISLPANTDPPGELM